MSQKIRIGTRDSQLALWQAKTVQQQLAFLGHETELVPVKSTGDLNLEQPLYAMGTVGVFTRTLDIALLNGEIDIAVHSFKDVPTQLPKGIVQAAVLKRGNPKDLLVFKKNEEFLAQPDAIIATSSIRRKAQWLNRYPKHTITDIRGNVNTRLQKLEDSDWNGAIFAAAGLHRIGIRPPLAFPLDWMVPAPAQGAVVVMTTEQNQHIIDICSEFNDPDTELCTRIEREFMQLLEGGCSAPIGALATFDEDKISMTGVLLSEDGSKKIEVTQSRKRGNHKSLAADCAKAILDKGGKRIMVSLSGFTEKAEICSTKSLTKTQLNLFPPEILVQARDFVKTKPNRIPPKTMERTLEHVIITSKNAVDALLHNFGSEGLNFGQIYCVGRKTRRSIKNHIGEVTYMAKNAKELAQYLVDGGKVKEATFFCSQKRLNDLPDLLSEHQIELHEIETYKTELDSEQMGSNIKKVMFYSPSTIESYLLKNTNNIIAYCIGESTAKVAREHFKQVHVAKIPTVESVIELVNEHLNSKA
jgi:hydroxymethylbilane synthase